MRRDVPRVDVRGLLKFECAHGWHACPPGRFFWELLDLLEHDKTWDFGEQPHCVLDAARGGAVLMMLRAPSYAASGVSKLAARGAPGAPPVFSVHVPPTCERVVFIKRFKYRKWLQVGACSMPSLR